MSLNQRNLVLARHTSCSNREIIEYNGTCRTIVLIPTGVHHMAADFKKLQELVLYISKRSQEDEAFGAVKLNKLLFYADFTAYRRLGKSITGADCQHLPEGPAPRELLQVRRTLIDQGTIDLVRRDYFDGIQERVVANREPDLAVFTADEVAIADEVIKEAWGISARTISDVSHDEFGWRATKDGESIPYETAWIAPGPLTSDQIAVGTELARKHGLTH